IGLVFSASFFSYNAVSQTTRMLKKNIVLQMPGEDGSNGASVAWHPVQKKYYAAFAGKASFPLSVFDAAGKRISPDDLTTQIDVRGLWYNDDSKLICGNAYKDLGWFSYKPDAKGIPQELKIVIPGIIQPSAQSVGTYNSKNRLVYFLDYTEIRAFDDEGKPVEDSSFSLLLNIPEEFEDDADLYMEENYNLTTLVFTGINKNEFGLLNYAKSRIELYDKKTGTLSQILKLPEDAISYDWLNFAFTNGIYWLFDKDNRNWVGYK
ncbi:MAG TPA: hypothetical protein VI548_03860, partial [Chitinophagaceae bacterium]|nr:hypothetical protein [Chitinophagaceae bacterium]